MLDIISLYLEKLGVILNRKDMVSYAEKVITQGV
jgi:hypothetical protein